MTKWKARVQSHGRLATGVAEDTRNAQLVPVTLAAATVLLVTGSVNLQVPLYAAYAERAEVGHATTASVFAAYVAGLMPVLIFLGGISDRIGRKTCLLLGLVAAGAATLLVTLSPGIAGLLPARILQGIAVGLSLGAATAYISALLGDQPVRAARIIAPVSALGLGGGALSTTIALAFERSLTPATYPLMLAAIFGLFGALAVLAPSQPPRGGPLVRLPLFSRGMLSAGAAIGVAWAVSGLVVAVLPTQLAHHGLAIWSGPVLFIVAVAGVAVQPFARGLASRRALQVSLFVVPTGYALMVTATAHHMLAALLLGACITGMGCYGFAYLGGLTRVSEFAGEHKARAVSGFLLCAYTGFGLPSIGVGIVADSIGLTAALTLFGGAIVVLYTGVALLLAREPKTVG